MTKGLCPLEPCQGLRPWTPSVSAQAVEIRVRGRVQGVGFRPTVWRLARALGLAGEVLNDAEGVLIRIGGTEEAIAAFIARIEREPPPLSRIDRIETRPFAADLPPEFRIAESVGGAARTEVTPDAAICPDCAAEIADPSQRRHRYPFANCTHCGPRLSIVRSIPYDRARTTMAPFAMCAACAAEYHDPADRRFHAEAIACPACGPRAILVRLDGRAIDASSDCVDHAARLIAAGEIVAIKGLGGYQLACAATRADVVARLRRLKRRDAKPFALMARDLDVIRRYCRLGAEEACLLGGPAAPIVLLEAAGQERLPDAVAPGLRTLGFMLPTTPLHLLILRGMDAPLVMTSGNLSDEPQATADGEAKERLSGIARYALVHDREIANRVDDSVVRVMAGRPRVLRRARGFAPAPIRLPQGFAAAPSLLAFGAELKATFCLLQDGAAILSQHQGDLEDAGTSDDYRRNLRLYAALFDHRPAALAADCHPEYLSSKLARARAEAEAIPLIEVQHHHAHLAACLAENSYPLDGPPVLGIVLDGLGWGADGRLWGGEFLLADYRGYERLGCFKPVAMPGGAAAVREPWRNLYAHLMAGMGWTAFAARFSALALHEDLARRPRAVLDTMTRTGINAPLASSCGRLFDAVAAALGLCPERQAYEGQAASMLEAIVDDATLRHESDALAYRLDIATLRAATPAAATPPLIDPAPMWNALLGDLARNTPAPVIAARFHKGLALAIAAMAARLRGGEGGPRFAAIALSGGCFQNRVLLEETLRRLLGEGFSVLAHGEIPANDGGIALGQAAVAAARLIAGREEEGTQGCASESQAAS